MIRITVQLENADYSKIAKLAMPIIIETLAGKSDAGMWLKLLSKFKHPAGKIYGAVLTALPTDTKNRIIADMVNDCGGIISETCNRLLSEKGVPLTAASVTATQGMGVELAADIQYKRGHRDEKNSFPRIS